MKYRRALTEKMTLDHPPPHQLKILPLNAVTNFLPLLSLTPIGHSAGNVQVLLQSLSSHAIVRNRL